MEDYKNLRIKLEKISKKCFFPGATVDTNIEEETKYISKNACPLHFTCLFGFKSSSHGKRCETVFTRSKELDPE